MEPPPDLIKRRTPDWCLKNDCLHSSLWIEGQGRRGSGRGGRDDIELIVIPATLAIGLSALNGGVEEVFTAQMSDDCYHRHQKEPER